jgi:predicted MPP superfamily phosphohydrolase
MEGVGVGLIATGMVGCLLVFGVFFVYSIALAPRWRAPFARVWAVVVVVVLVACIGSLGLSFLPVSPRAVRPVTQWLLTGLAVLLYALLGLVVVRLVSLAWRLLAWARGTASDGVSPRVRFVRWATCLVLVGAVGVAGFGYRSAHHPSVSPVSVSNTQLPAAFDGYRIALVTDLHIGEGLSGDFLRQVVDQVNAQHADLIVVAGDMQDGTVAELGPEMCALGDLSAPDGVLVTTGNHEFYDGGAQQWVDFYRSLGLDVLDNSGVELSRGGASIDVRGINDRTGVAPLNPDLQLAAQRLSDAAGVPVDGAGRFRILIAHEPLQVEDDGAGGYVDASQPGLPAELGVDLMLSGHTHGGQLWPVNYLVTAQQPVLDGVHEVSGVTVVTSRGVGAWGPPVRVGAPPEIPVITLRVGS